MSDPVAMETDSPALLAAVDSLAPQTALHEVELNVAHLQDKVYKDECLYCFDTSYNKGGLFISTKSFFAVCLEHVPILVSKEHNKGFVLYKKCKILTESDEPKDKKLSIKFEQVDEIEEYSFVVYPNLDRSFIISEATLPSDAYRSAHSILTHTSAALQDRLEAGISEWDGEQILNSVAAEHLIQINPGKKIPYSGWACEEPDCGLKENLWLNLTDGVIMCGRMQVLHSKEGSTTLPGNGHAKLHFERTSHPVAVKLGTISNGDADVYDYLVNDAVKDPKLAEHLQHFGLDINKMEKTEKSTLEMELDLNQKWEWSRCLEDGVTLESVFGPNFSGIINIGSSCYINSVLQMLYVIPDFLHVYGGAHGLSLMHRLAPAEVNEDFNAQLAKIVVSLQTGKYSKAAAEDNGFKPTQFRRIVGRGHPEFSTARQQDAEEYLRHLFDKIDDNVTGDVNPVDALRFQIETRLLDCSSGYARYSEKEDTILSLQIPLEIASNMLGEGPASRKVIDLGSILDAAFSDEIIEGFKSPITNKLGNAKTRMGIKTFPDFLVLQLKRFGYSEDRSIKKLDVDVLLDELIDLEKYAAKGPQPGENLLPDDVNADVEHKLNEEFVEQIVEMGFSQNAARKAVYLTKNKSAQEATDWIFANMDQPDFNEAHPDLKGNRKADNKVDPRLQELTVLGFPVHKARIALEQANGDVNAAAEWLFMNGDSLPDEEVVEPVRERAKKQCRNGPGKYHLKAIISHMGSSPHTGHYVAHIKRDNVWYLFNDEKVAVSQNPPVSLGYLYLLERLPQV
uniref:Ubiquitin carboxyl-terminal hydrolase n=1 Tax=Panagrolaimus sp. JU765 TaxID=591449 RepID=A0AC34RNK7_9BILA